MCPRRRMKSMPEEYINTRLKEPSDQNNSLKTFEQHILLVEDEPDVALVTKTRLELEGFKVFTVNEGSEVLSYIDKVSPDLMLLDLKMSRLDGYSVYKQMKSDKRTKDIPIILFSDSSDCLRQYRDVLEAHRQLELSVDDIISKPYETKTLLKKIKKLIKVKRF